MAVLAPELVVLLFGEQWMPSVPVLQILAIVGVLRSVTYFKGAIFLAMGKPIWRLRLGVLNSTLNVIGFFIAVHWGIVAVAFAYLTRACIMFPIGQWAVSKLINIPLGGYLRQFIPSVVSMLAMGLAIMCLRILVVNSLGLIGTVVCGSAIGVVLYCAVLYYFEPNLLRQFWEILVLASTKIKPRNS